MNLQSIQVLAIFVLAMALFAGADAILKEDSHYLYHEESNKYYKLHPQNYQWHTAREICTQEGATLPTYSSIRDRMVLLHVQLQNINTRPEFKLWLNAATKEEAYVGENQYLTVKGVIWPTDSSTELPFVCVRTPIDCNTTATGYSPGPDRRSCYKFHIGTTRGINWKVAFQTCEAEGAHLAIPNSVKEQHYIMEFGASKARQTWFAIGFHDLFVDGVFHTVDGKRLAEGVIVRSEHRPQEGGHCGFVNIETMSLYTQRCDSEKWNFLCEKEVGTS